LATEFKDEKTGNFREPERAHCGTFEKKKKRKKLLGVHPKMGLASSQGEDSRRGEGETKNGWVPGSATTWLIREEERGLSRRKTYGGGGGVGFQLKLGENTNLPKSDTGFSGKRFYHPRRTFV